MIESRLRWQCRRGMRELDEFLQNYFDQDYGNASDDEKEAFRELLTLSNPRLIGYLLGGQEPADRGIADVVRKIRDRTHAP